MKPTCLIKRVNKINHSIKLDYMYGQIEYAVIETNIMNEFKTEKSIINKLFIKMIACSSQVFNLLLRAS